MAVRQKSVAIRQSIIERVGAHPSDIIKVTADQWGITREAARLHVKALEEDGVLSSTGRTSGKQFVLKSIAEESFILETKGLQEDIVWRERIKPLLTDAPENVVNICGIGFTEMVNNVVDHSESEQVAINVKHTAAITSIEIHDRGVGIFRKIRQACHLTEDREAILELSKGKLTTAPQGHSGYGIFFTSRMMDVFQIHSGRLVFSHTQPDDDWLLENDDSEVDGTFVWMAIASTTKRTSNEIYSRFCGASDNDVNAGLTKTHVPIRLAQYRDEQLVSRSQAKRVLARFEKFSEVLLDFRGVDFVGQAFADEIFRVFKREHPDVSLLHVHANPDVERMIGLAIATEREHRQLHLFD